MPLTVVFRVDATTTDEARRQLTDLIGTAGKILAGLGGPVPPGLVSMESLAGPGGRPTPRQPWDHDPRGMGQ